nr:hypothetical protein CFP56_20909 [Quercus suber]
MWRHKAPNATTIIAQWRSCSGSKSRTFDVHSNKASERARAPRQEHSIVRITASILCAICSFRPDEMRPFSVDPTKFGICKLSAPRMSSFSYDCSLVNRQLWARRQVSHTKGSSSTELKNSGPNSVYKGSTRSMYMLNHDTSL